MTKEYKPLQIIPLKTGSTFVRPVQMLPEHVQRRLCAIAFVCSNQMVFL